MTNRIWINIHRKKNSLHPPPFYCGVLTKTNDENIVFWRHSNSYLDPWNFIWLRQLFRRKKTNHIFFFKITNYPWTLEYISSWATANGCCFSRLEHLLSGSSFPPPSSKGDSLWKRETTVSLFPSLLRLILFPFPKSLCIPSEIFCKVLDLWLGCVK